jgi:hypothetical protein
MIRSYHIYLCGATVKARCRAGGINKSSVINELPDCSEGSRRFWVGIISRHTGPQSINCKNIRRVTLLVLPSLDFITKTEVHMHGLVGAFGRTPSSLQVRFLEQPSRVTSQDSFVALPGGCVGTRVPRLKPPF